MQLALWQLAALLAALVVALVVAELLERPRLRAILKTVASVTFVVAGALLLPLSASAGWLVLAGLALSLLGDVALIPKGSKPLFLGGLGAFLAAHLCYAAAFVVLGQAPPHALGAAAVLVAVGVPLARWLARHVKGSMRAPVAGYVVAITAMVALAAGAVGAGARPTLLIGAVLFYLSDLCVARERFVVRSRWNAAVGLPLYYAAQLLLIDGVR
ncbi:MAG: lysoplasmalogenase [Deltaproteobacteria bacterium]|nr:lysoplasmalogenase [Deltaproteobacteria bacterium]